jgi:tRNA A-37 threonylcarbamoyl transferase component Bud32
VSSEPGPEAMPSWLTATLLACGLLDRADVRHVHGQMLTGGVSSDVWRVDLPTGPVCVKRALPRLRVTAVWEAPVRRYASEAAWIARAQIIEPDAVPPLLGVDHGTGAIVLGWLDPHVHPLWKQQLLDGRVDPAVAEAIGGRLGTFHSAMSAVTDSSAPDDFDHVDLFESLRLAPYFRTTAAAHPHLAARFDALCDQFGAAASTVVHGDVSPKNILVGPNGPVLLDAECACWGDPAFDVAFLLTHLLLKARHRPANAWALHDSAVRAWAAYRGATANARTTTQTNDQTIEAQVAGYWAGLALARIDGSSPVEYLSTEVRDTLRHELVDYIVEPRSTLADLDPLWRLHP